MPTETITYYIDDEGNRHPEPFEGWRRFVRYVFDEQGFSIEDGVNPEIAEIDNG
jgi:hypothetical protein